MIDFPATPTVGQVFTSGGQSWTWDGTKWLPAGLYGGPFVPQAGFVPAMNDNRIINGDMRIDQRNNGAGGTANSYTVDRWLYGCSVVGKGVWQRFGPYNLPDVPFAYILQFTSSGVSTPAAGDSYQFAQLIEADMISDFQWGIATAKPVTLSFWAYANLAGTYSGAISNFASDRGYPFSFALPASVWTKVVVTIPGDTGGTWVMAGNAGAAALHFDLGSGSSVRAPAGAWTNGAIVGASGAQNILSVNGGFFSFTGVKLEVGSVATPFNRQSLAASLADCQRYYEKSYDYGISPGATSQNNGSFLLYATGLTATANNLSTYIAYKVSKRAAPTVTMYSTISGAAGKLYSANASADVTATVFAGGMTGISVYGAETQAISNVNLRGHWTSLAEL